MSIQKASRRLFFIGTTLGMKKMADVDVDVDVVVTDVTVVVVVVVAA